MQLAGLDQTSFGAAFLMGMKYASVSDPFLNSLVHFFYIHFFKYKHVRLFSLL